jgi:hypothetical protein
MRQYRIFAWLLAGVIFPLVSLAQHWSVQTKSFQQLAQESTPGFGHSGFGVSVSKFWKSTKKSQIEAGIEYSDVAWGRQVLAQIGYHLVRQADKTNWWFRYGGVTHHGFMQNSGRNFYVFGIGGMASANYNLGRDFSLGIGTGFRFYSSPGFFDYSDVNTYIDWPLELHINYIPRKKKSPKAEWD